MNMRGNILFLILLAIILFVALTYAVNSGMRGGGNNATNESTQAKVSEILNYFTVLDTGVQRMMLTGGVKDYQLDFYYQSAHKFVHGGIDNPNCTSSACAVFDPAGGGIPGRTWGDVSKRYTLYNDITSTAYAGFYTIPGLGTTLPETIYQVQAVPLTICKAINAAAGLGQVVLLNATQTTTGNANYANAYQYGFTLGYVGDTVRLENIPAAAASAGTFCACSLSTEAACEAAAWEPNIMHVLYIR